MLKKEILKTLAQITNTVKCAYIYTQDFGFIPAINTYGWSKDKICVLKVNHNQQDFEDFLQSLDFEYDEGLGNQELYGIVLFEDNSWLERYEYDGCERWDYKTTPQIPEECL